MSQILLLYCSHGRFQNVTKLQHTIQYKTQESGLYMSDVTLVTCYCHSAHHRSRDRAQSLTLLCHDVTWPSKPRLAPAPAPCPVAAAHNPAPGAEDWGWHRHHQSSLSLSLSASLSLAIIIVFSHHHCQVNPIESFWRLSDKFLHKNRLKDKLGKLEGGSNIFVDSLTSTRTTSSMVKISRLKYLLLLDATILRKHLGVTRNEMEKL